MFDQGLGTSYMQVVTNQFCIRGVLGRNQAGYIIRFQEMYLAIIKSLSRG